jgi:outer membrane receptor for monomeric catechols
MKTESSSRTRQLLLLGVAALLTAASLSAQAPLPPSNAAASGQVSTSATPEDIVELSPFEVSAGSERGYYATQTLNGTRLKTDLKDIGSSMTIFTEQMMDDLGATNINDVLAFAPNTDPALNTITDTTGNGNDFINIGTQYVTRGANTSIVGQDFFNNGVPTDRYNSEAFTFTRGPNSILFGLGNAAGAFVSSTKRAKNKTATTVEFRADDRESFRTMLDHNQVIKKDLLAIRFCSLDDKAKGFRLPSESQQMRRFLTLTFTPFTKTSIRVNY